MSSNWSFFQSQEGFSLVTLILPLKLSHHLQFSLRKNTPNLFQVLVLRVCIGYLKAFFGNNISKSFWKHLKLWEPGKVSFRAIRAVLTGLSYAGVFPHTNEDKCDIPQLKPNVSSCAPSLSEPVSCSMSHLMGALWKENVAPELQINQATRYKF